MSKFPQGNIESPAKDKMVTVAYWLGIGSILFYLLAVVGVIISYMNKEDAPEYAKSHYQFQIRTFWISLLFLAIGVITVFILIGVLILLFTVIWVIIRCVKGLKYSNKKEPYPNPKTWLF